MRVEERLEDARRKDDVILIGRVEGVHHRRISRPAVLVHRGAQFDQVLVRLKGEDADDVLEELVFVHLKLDDGKKCHKKEKNFLKSHLQSRTLLTAQSDWSTDLGSRCAR